jgi:hypothetical protein
MPGFLYHVGASAICPHGGQVSTLPGNPRVRLSGQLVATMADASLVAGCAFTVPTSKPQPCIKVQWLMPAARVRAGGQFVILRLPLPHRSAGPHRARGRDDHLRDLIEQVLFTASG